MHDLIYHIPKAAQYPISRDAVDRLDAVIQAAVYDLICNVVCYAETWSHAQTG